MTDKLMISRFSLFVLWVTATYLGAFAAAASFLIPYLVISIPMTLSMVGFFQWVVIRLYFRNIKWWVPATAVGMVIGLSAEELPGYYLLAEPDLAIRTPVIVAYTIITLGLKGFIMGTIVGIFQWASFRNILPNSALWILASAGGWALFNVILNTPEIPKIAGGALQALFGYCLVTGVFIAWRWYPSVFRPPFSTASID